jgi:hypothetical protein
MAHGNPKRRSGDMGTLEFMNQDGEWEKFPTDEDLIAVRDGIRMIPATPPIHPEITTICHLCNEPFPMEQVMITGGSPLTGYTWSCPKCHAVTSLGKA